MKVIFLDFDGVLNSASSFLYETHRRKRHKEQGVKGPVMETLCNVCAACFQEVLYKYPEVKIVISSTWRTFFDLNWLQAKLASYHIDSSRVIGATPVDHWGKSRGKEIQQWLDSHPEVTHYVIIDDNDWDITPHHGADRFVKTTWEAGMGVEHAEELIFKLTSAHAGRVKERVQKDAEILANARAAVLNSLPKPEGDNGSN